MKKIINFIFILIFTFTSLFAQSQAVFFLAAPGLSDIGSNTKSKHKHQKSYKLPGSFGYTLLNESQKIVHFTFDYVLQNNLKLEEVVAAFLLGPDSDPGLRACYSEVLEEFKTNKSILTDKSKREQYINTLSHKHNISGLPDAKKRAADFPLLPSVVEKLYDIYLFRLNERLIRGEADPNPIPTQRFPGELYLTEMRNVAAHAFRVALLIKIVGKKLNLPEGELTKIMLAGLLHDLGKGECIEIIMNPRVLTKEQRNKVDSHAAHSAGIIEDQLRMRETTFPVQSLDLVDESVIFQIRNHHLQTPLDEHSLDPQTILGTHLLAACDIVDALLDMTRLHHGGHPKQISLVLKILENKHIKPEIINEFKKLAEADINADADAKTFYDIIAQGQRFLRLYYGITLASLLKNGIWQSERRKSLLHSDKFYFEKNKLLEQQFYKAIKNSNLSLEDKIFLVLYILSFIQSAIRARISGIENKGVVIESLDPNSPVIFYDASFRVDISEEAWQAILRGVPVLISGNGEDIENLYAHLRARITIETGEQNFEKLKDNLYHLTICPETDPKIKIIHLEEAILEAYFMSPKRLQIPGKPITSLFSL